MLSLLTSPMKTPAAMPLHPETATVAVPPTATLFDMLRFARSWLARPLRTGAVAPSGAALAALMTAEIGPGSGPVIELGPGTGPFTRALLGRGIAETDLALVEANPAFARLLARRFPGACVLTMDAARLGELELFGAGGAGAVLSGLPILSMPLSRVEAILSGAFRHLRKGAVFYQFTYGLACPVPQRLMEALGLEAAHAGRTLANVPPANVYRIRRRGLLPDAQAVGLP